MTSYSVGQKIIRNSHGYFAVQSVSTKCEICARLAGVYVVQYCTFLVFQCPRSGFPFFRVAIFVSRSYSVWVFISTEAWKNQNRNAISRLNRILCLWSSIYIGFSAPSSRLLQFTTYHTTKERATMSARRWLDIGCGAGGTVFRWRQTAAQAEQLALETTAGLDILCRHTQN